MRNQKKIEFAAVMEYRNTDAGRAFRRLIGVCISDLREKNDVAEGDDFIRNQGAIREFKLVYKNIGQKVSKTEYDGAFGE